MTQKEYLQFAKNTFDEMLQVIESKSNDYSGEDDPFANIRFVEQQDVIDAETGMFVRFSDKYARLRNFIKKQRMMVKNESYEDTLKDIIGYAVLMLAYSKEKKK